MRGRDGKRGPGSGRACEVQAARGDVRGRLGQRDPGPARRERRPRRETAGCQRYGPLPHFPPPAGTGGPSASRSPAQGRGGPRCASVTCSGRHSQRSRHEAPATRPASSATAPTHTAPPARRVAPTHAASPITGQRHSGGANEQRARAGLGRQAPEACGLCALPLPSPSPSRFHSQACRSAASPPSQRLVA